jgi:hypothetical protein
MQHQRLCSLLPGFNEMSLPRLVAQIAVIGVQVLGKAVYQASRQAMRSAWPVAPYAAKAELFFLLRRCAGGPGGRRQRRRAIVVEPADAAAQDGAGRGAEHFECQGRRRKAFGGDGAAGDAQELRAPLQSQRQDVALPPVQGRPRQSSHRGRARLCARHPGSVGSFLVCAWAATPDIMMGQCDQDGECKMEGGEKPSKPSHLYCPRRSASSSGERAPAGLLLLVLGLLRRRRRLVLWPVVLAWVGEGSVVGAAVSACAGRTQGVSAFSTVFDRTDRSDRPGCARPASSTSRARAGA